MKYACMRNHNQVAILHPTAIAGMLCTNDLVVTERGRHVDMTSREAEQSPSITEW
jgi:hypothetical protein